MAGLTALEIILACGCSNTIQRTQRYDYDCNNNLNIDRNCTNDYHHVDSKPLSILRELDQGEYARKN